MISKLVAGAFIVAFFAALPAWFLSTLDGFVELRCAGAPWRCSVRRYNLLSRRESTVPTSWVSVRSQAVTRRGRTVREHVLQIDGADVLDARPDQREVQALADEMNRARAAGRPFDRALDPTGTFWLAVSLLVVFAGAGLLIAVSGARRGPAARS